MRYSVRRTQSGSLVGEDGRVIELPVDFNVSSVGISVEIWNNNLNKFK